MMKRCYKTVNTVQFDMDPDLISGSRSDSTLQLCRSLKIAQKICQNDQWLGVQYMWHMYNFFLYMCIICNKRPLVTGVFSRIFTEIYSFAIEKIRYGSVNNFFRGLNYEKLQVRAYLFSMSS